MDRRTALGAIGSSTVSLASAGCLSSVFGGCSNPGIYDLELTPVVPADLAKQHSKTVSYGRAAELIRLGASERVPFVPYDGDPPLEAGVVYELDGNYYRIAIDEKGPETDVTAYEYRVTAVGDDAGPPPAGETIAVSELPDLDRATLLTSSVGTELLSNGSSVPVSMTVAYGNSSAAERSVIVPEQEYEYIRANETVLQLTRTGSRTVTLLPRWIRVSTVGDSPDEYATHLLSQEGIELEKSALSVEAREYLEQSFQGARTEVCPDEELPDHVAEVHDALGMRSTDETYVKYAGTWYYARLTYHQKE